MFRARSTRQQRTPCVVTLLGLLMLLAGFLAAPASAQTALPASMSAPAALPAANPAPVTFMRDLLGSGQIAPGHAWTIGGGYLYWARCQFNPASTPQGTEAQPNAGYTGYLRRWPIRGGAAV